MNTVDVLGQVLEVLKVRDERFSLVLHPNGPALWDASERRLTGLAFYEEDWPAREVVNWAVEEARMWSMARIGVLELAIRTTLCENGHLADGEVCTLKRLKDAIGME